MLTDTATSFGTISKTIHWLTVLLVFSLFALGVFMTKMLDSGWEIEQVFFVFSLHKTLGMAVLVLAVLRVLWRLLQPQPHPIESHAKAEVMAAKTVHWLLYALIFLMPITGWLHHSATSGLAPIWGPFPRLGFVPQVEYWEKFLGWTHYATAWLMGGIVMMHVAGALKHAVIDRDGTLRRMLPGRGGVIATQTEPKTRLPLGLASVTLAALLAVIVVLRPVAAPEVESQEVAASTGFGDWAVQYENSLLEIEVIQNGTPTKGAFASWSAEIFHDPEFPEIAQVSIDIAIPSLTLGSVTTQALGADFLDSASFPTARFTGEGFIPRDDGMFDLNGTLELAGVEQPLTLTFALDIDGEKALAEGTATILRLDHGVGEGNTAVAPEVQVRFVVEAVTGGTS
ncbi:MAG: cytochrome b/b6 domain-containing protein [Pseudomonadota bacterium]